MSITPTTTISNLMSDRALRRGWCERCGDVTLLRVESLCAGTLAQLSADQPASVTTTS